MKRKIIRIDESKCDGCGLCAVACAEAAIQIKDGKARLVSETYCDGLGACLGECPRGALTIEERESEKFDAAAVETRLSAQRACPGSGAGSGCPGSRARELVRERETQSAAGAPSRLTHWPVQLHLISPSAPWLAGADLLLSADCAAYAAGGFHEEFLKDRKLAIACPKLDDGKEIYLGKLVSLIDEAGINSITVLTMEVPCCSGLLALARQAVSKARRKIPLTSVVIGLQGEILTRQSV